MSLMHPQTPLDQSAKADVLRGGSIFGKVHSSPRVVCIVLNWNGWADTIACVERLAQDEYPHLFILIVDNGSTNDSVAQISSVFPLLEILQTGANLGFAAGNNRGIQRAIELGAEYVWLLNNDTLVQPDTLTELMTMAKNDPQLGQIGSVLSYADNPDVIQAWGGGDVNLWTGSTRHYRGPVPQEKIAYLTAASVLMPRKVLAQAGLFAEHYFMYFEDTDLSFRIKACGWKLGVCAGAKLLHKEGASSGARTPQFDGMLTTSGIIFLRQYSPSPPISLSIFVGGRALKRLIGFHFQCFVAIISAWRRRNRLDAIHPDSTSRVVRRG